MLKIPIAVNIRKCQKQKKQSRNQIYFCNEKQNARNEQLPTHAIHHSCIKCSIESRRQHFQENTTVNRLKCILNRDVLMHYDSIDVRKTIEFVVAFSCFSFPINAIFQVKIMSEFV